MDLSIFLSKLFGLYFLIVIFLFSYRKEEILHEIQSFYAHTGSLLLSGVFNLLGGLAVLIGHPIWEARWETLITLIGLLMLIKGIFHFGYPRLALKWGQKLMQQKKQWNFMLILLAVLGAFLTYKGFTA